MKLIIQAANLGSCDMGPVHVTVGCVFMRIQSAEHGVVFPFNQSSVAERKRSQMRRSFQQLFGLG